MRLASDFSYFGRKPAALHVCKRSVGLEGAGTGLRSLPREGARSGGWGAVKEGAQERVWGQEVKKIGRGRLGGLKPMRCGWWQMRGGGLLAKRAAGGGQCSAGEMRFREKPDATLPAGPPNSTSPW